ncbi:MAG: hypothetical protein FWG88_01085 [Oscillospiraceae bacterium]|nr:hypothetical protein [Oscillospiraceae bacterium]
MNWWDDEDWIDPDEWTATVVEVVGTTYSMFWVTNKKTKERGLFKPESNWRRSAFNEYAASKIGNCLGVPCARLLVGNVFGGGGCISMDVRQGYSERILSGESLGRVGSLLNYEKSKDGKPVYDMPREMSFEGLLPFLPKEAELGMVKMMFFDSIIRNAGRHGSNFSFAIDDNRAITAFLPLYDQGNAVLEDTSSSDYGGRGGRGGRGGWGRRRGSAFPYYGHGGMHRPFPLEELNKCIKRDYPDLVRELVAKTRTEEFRTITTRLDCYELMMDRVNEFINQ